MIHANALSVSFGSNRAVDGVSLSVSPEEIVALCGPNGAGKSTLIAALAGEHPACVEAVQYDGVPLGDLSPSQLARHRVFLEQEPMVATDLTLLDVLEIGVPIEVSPADLARIRAQIISDFNFGEILHNRISTLSGGQRHCAHLARVLMQLQANRTLGYSCYLFLDEPTANLDIGFQIAVLSRIKKLCSEGVGIIIVLHDLNLAAAYADRVLIMKAGELLIADSPEAALTDNNLTAIYDTPILVDRASTGQVIIQPKLETANA
ncbi:MAG: ATP-binding cassette domain-containing protein [Rhodobacteraceae bacterium]|nr:ATP-binding cassette domain-containing protein [Paracoccaceae bacterium]